MYTYHQSTGVLELNGSSFAVGYSGYGADKNRPEDQNVPNEGPLPEGFYTIGPARDDAKLGTYAMPLTPDIVNAMFGRAGFYIHGDSVKHPGCASEGCIVMGLLARVTIAQGSDRRLEVVA